MALKRTTKQFIEEANQVHSNKYNYSNTVYTGAHEKVEIICPEHGNFIQTACVHLNGSGCPKCGLEKIGNKKRSSLDTFIEKANQIHNNKYDYSKVEYKSGSKKVCIICPEHGEFWQTPNNHLANHGCPDCSGRGKLSTEKFIKKAKEVHGDKYDYSKVNYINSSSKVEIICPKHGSFWQQANSHLRGTGCPQCAFERTNKQKFLTTEEFIEKSRKVHGDRYDYSKSEYFRHDVPVIIICPEHGEFEQRPDSHWQGNGCQKCGKSHGELSIQRFLEENNIKYIDQYEIDIDKNINISGKAQIDFYLPDYNLAIEYNGEQHYRPIHYFGGQISFNRQQKRDMFVRNYCEENKIKLLEIKYSDIDLITKLNNFIYEKEDN